MAAIDKDLGGVGEDVVGAAAEAGDRLLDAGGAVVAEVAGWGV